MLKAILGNMHMTSYRRSHLYAAVPMESGIDHCGETHMSEMVSRWPPIFLSCLDHMVSAEINNRTQRYAYAGSRARSVILLILSFLTEILRVGDGTHLRMVSWISKLELTTSREYSRSLRISAYTLSSVPVLMSTPKRTVADSQAG